MKIEKIEISRITLPLRKPVSTAYGTFSTQDLLVVKLHVSESVYGFGEVPVGGTLNYGGFTPESVAIDIARSYGERLIGRQFGQPLDLLWVLERPVSRSQEEREISSKAAIDIALWDLQGKLRSTRLSNLLGTLLHDELEIGHILSAESPPEMAAEAATCFRQGCTSFKVKLSGDLAEDRLRVEAIRSAVGDRPILWVDPNEQWSAEETVTWIKSLGDYKIDYVEQPVPGWDFEGLAKVRGAIQPTKVIADQSVYSVHDAERIVRMRAVDVVTIKTMRLGISKAVKVAELCAEAGLQCKIGAGGEGAIGGAAAIHVSHVAPKLANCNELSFPRYETLAFEGLIQGRKGEWSWRVEASPGLGVKPSQTYEPVPLISMPD